MELPNIKGRAIWNNKRLFEEVQVPKLDMIEAEGKLISIANEFHINVRKNNQEMLIKNEFKKSQENIIKKMKDEKKKK